MNLPNTITLLRLFLILVFVALWGAKFYISATVVFFIASATDMIDGHLARATNQETKLGALLDPLVDKILVTTGLVMLVELTILPSWAVVLVLAREFLVTGLRTILIDKGIVLSAGNLGKLKTLLQIVSIVFLFLGISLHKHGNAYEEVTMTFGLVVFWLALVITVMSGVQYALRGKKMLEEVDAKT